MATLPGLVRQGGDNRALFPPSNSKIRRVGSGFNELFMDNHGTDDPKSLQHAIRVALKLLSDVTLNRATPGYRRVLLNRN
jgi:hypothetical protein